MKPEENVSVNGTLLTCKHCGGGTFTHLLSLMNTPAMTFLGLDFLNREADVYICFDCGFLHWFLNPSARSKSSELATEITCLECNTEIPVGERACSKCGWTDTHEDPY